MAVSVDIAFHDLINPQNTDKVEDSLPEFLAQIQLNDEDISKALALIGHKLQSPMELEALTAQLRHPLALAGSLENLLHRALARLAARLEQAG